MANQPRDRWDKMDVLAKITGAVLIPIILLVIGNWHTTEIRRIEHARAEQLEEIEDARRALDRAAIILRHLASENARERELAMHFVEYLNSHNQFPNELYPILISALADEDEAVQHSARTVLTDVLERNPAFAADERFLFEPRVDIEAPERSTIELRPEYLRSLEGRLRER
jgi:hypothetical protein